MVFWIPTLRGLVDGNQNFRRTQRLYLQHGYAGDVPPKHLLTATILQGVTTQRIIDIFTAIIDANLVSVRR
jgi:hypothetical protein